MSGQVILYFEDQSDALHFALAAGSVMSGEDAPATNDLVQETARVTRIRLDAANKARLANRALPNVPPDRVESARSRRARRPPIPALECLLCQPLNRLPSSYSPRSTSPGFARSFRRSRKPSTDIPRFSGWSRRHAGAAAGD